MGTYADQLARVAEPDISVFAVLLAYGVFGTLLVLAVRAAGSGRRETLAFLGLFTWYVTVTGVVFWWLALIRLPPDSVSYWRWSMSIVQSGFDADAIEAVIRPSPANLGVNSFILLESLVGTILPARYEVLDIFNILLATLAVFFACRVARMLFGDQAQVLTFVLFVCYFAIYWRCLHNLREAIQLFFLGASLWTFFRWRASGRAISLVAALGAAFLVVMFRVENALIFMAFLSCYALFTARSALQMLPRLVVILAAVAVGAYLSYRVTGGNPLLAINWARKIREEGGYSLPISDLNSYVDVIWQAPLTLTFFLAPVKPWEVELGAKFVLNYLHGLVAFPYVLLGVVGAIAAIRRHAERKMILAIVLSLLAMASVYSIAEISAETAARHSLFWFFAMMPFTAHGIGRVRVGLAVLARAYRASGRIGPEPVLRPDGPTR
jgi:hypothetical protein